MALSKRSFGSYRRPSGSVLPLVPAGRLALLAIFILLGLSSTGLAGPAQRAADSEHEAEDTALELTEPEELLSRAIEYCRNLKSYQCRLSLHITKGEDSQDSEYLFYYKKPHQLRLHVEKGENRGSTVVIRKDGCIRGRRGGILSMFPVTLRPDDDRLYDLWDRGLLESDWETILKETRERLRKCRSYSVESVEGGKQFLLIIAGENGSLEETWLDANKFVLLKKRAYLRNGDRLEVAWTDIVLNPEFKTGFFYF